MALYYYKGSDVEHTQDGQEIFDRLLSCKVSGEDPEDLLDILLTRHAWPLIAQVVRRRLGSFYNPSDAAELTNEAAMQLLARLRRMLTEGPQGAEIRIGAFSAGIAANTVLHFISKRCPESSRLRKRLRYVFETDERLRLWPGPDGSTICGLAEHQNQPDGCGADAVEWCVARLRPRSTIPLPQLTWEILKKLPAPLELTKLVRLAGKLLGVQEPVYLPADPQAGVASALSDMTPSIAFRMELRQRLDWLWREVQLLPAPQRAALLLNLRSNEGAALWLFTDLGIASFGDMAAALEISKEQLAALWNELPLEDRIIGESLGLERQQVVNLRAAARQRLARRENLRTKGVAQI